MTRTSARTKAKKHVASNVSAVPLDSVFFHTKERAAQRKYIVKRNIVDEKKLSKRAQECIKIMELILNSGLERTILNLGPYYPHIVREFIVNLSPNFDNSTSPEYKRVHVKRHSFVFSVFVINELTGGSKTSWPRKGQVFFFCAQREVCHSKQDWHFQLVFTFPQVWDLCLSSHTTSSY